MTAYLIADVDVTDAAAYEEYRSKAPASIALHGGRYLARGGETFVLEGDWEPHRLVILEFPDLTALRAWYDSNEYKAFKAIRLDNAKSRIIALDGLKAPV
jgi:uncharacterized protein (DUF1330 family)